MAELPHQRCRASYVSRVSAAAEISRVQLAVRGAPRRFDRLDMPRQLKGRIGPNCLYMQSASCACIRKGGCEASSQGESMAEIRKLQLAEGKKQMVERFAQHFPDALHPDVLPSKTHINDVGTALELTALAFAKLPNAVADKWNLEAWHSKTPPEKVAWAR